MRPSLHFCELRVPWLSRLLRMKRKRSYVLLPNTLKKHAFFKSQYHFFLFRFFFSFFLFAFFNVFSIFCSRDKLTYDTCSFFSLVEYETRFKISITSHTKTMHRVFYQTIFRSRHSQRDERLCERLSNYCFTIILQLIKEKKSRTVGNAIYNSLHAPVCFSTRGQKHSGARTFIFRKILRSEGNRNFHTPIYLTISGGG